MRLSLSEDEAMCFCELSEITENGFAPTNVNALSADVAGMIISYFNRVNTICGFSGNFLKDEGTIIDLRLSLTHPQMVLRILEGGFISVLGVPRDSFGRAFMPVACTKE